MKDETALVDYVVRASKLYYGLSISELRQLAFQYAKKMNIKYPDQWNQQQMTGKGWYYLFMKRHPILSLRTPEQTSMHRIKSFCKENVEAFFCNYERVLTQVAPFQPNQIWNMDESGFSTVPTKVGKVISLKGSKRVGQVSSAERGTLVTMALAVNASGNSIPPFFLFPRKKMQTTFLENASCGSAGLANESGWMQQAEFVSFIEHFIQFVRPSKDYPALLLLDNHASHLSITALDLAAENGITLLTFPPHCSHRMQPLDVSVYGPVKTYYKSQCNTWQKAHAGQVLEIRHIPQLVCSTLRYALVPQTIIAGFEKTGIWPFNAHIFNACDFISATLLQENVTASTIENELGEDDQRRITVLDVPPVPAIEEIVAPESPEPSTDNNPSVLNDIEMPQLSDSNKIPVSNELEMSEPSTSKQSMSRELMILNEIGPLKMATPKKKSNRGRKAMTSTVLTSPKNMAALKAKEQKKAELKEKQVMKEAKQKQTKKQRSKTSSSIKKEPAEPKKLAIETKEKRVKKQRPKTSNTKRNQKLQKQ